MRIQRAEQELKERNRNVKSGRGIQRAEGEVKERNWEVKERNWEVKERNDLDWYLG
jgi:hypothetical protein